MMKIAIVANCQGESIKKCVDALNPSIETSAVMVHHVVNDPGWTERLIQENDLIFAHRLLQGSPVSLPSDKIIYLPNIAFNGYHPDLTFVRGVTKDGQLESVINMFGGYHSGITLYAYQNGFTQDEAKKLFCPEIYGRLGYFEAYDRAYDELIEEGRLCGLPLDAKLLRWARMAPFMYSSNHPKLFVIEDVVRMVLNNIGVRCLFNNVHEYIDDPLREMPIWPIYPGIAERFGLIGDTAFRANRNYSMVPLTSFIAESYCHFDRFDRDTLEAINLPVHEYGELIGPEALKVNKDVPGNPYSQVPSYQFWRNSVASVECSQFDPVVSTKFTLEPSDKVATAGSCFAQHIARTLASSGFNYLVAENAPEGMDSETALSENYGVYSARYGNLYTVRQLKQLLDRAEHRFSPVDEVWIGKSGGYIDPFRPQIKPGGFSSIAELTAARAEHFDAVQKMLHEMDCFVFTLGLTEGWQSKIDGAVFPLAPGVAGGIMNPDKYEFKNFSVDEMEVDLADVIGRIHQINPAIKIILTVSPVPLIATFDNRNALVATTFSKSALRLVADSASRRYEFIEYFPSYEIITGSYNRGAYFAEDLRDVRPEGVSHVMSVFMKHYTGQGGDPVLKADDALASPRRQANAFFDVICDEEAIANF
ncbi:GSCFA domain-containing protein [Sphingobium sp. CR28]|uniref:GSCFA domain-containing protein n=1 Tax=Sphingobium sp. CR28 TaxID=3400272 RepID=UPI003FED9ED8